jgi:hypothetical protein
MQQRQENRTRAGSKVEAGKALTQKKSFIKFDRDYS